MFPSRYYARCYFAGRYYAAVGSDDPGLVVLAVASARCVLACAAPAVALVVRPL